MRVPSLFWRTSSLTLGATLIALISAGCGDDDELPADELSYELFESTTLLDEATLSLLVEDTADGTLRFQGTPAALTGLAPLAVIVAPGSPQSPDGLLRLVRSVETDGNGLVVHTLPAPVQLAFRKLHVKMTRTIDETSGVVDWEEGTGRSSLQQGLSYSGGYWPNKSIEEYPVNGDNDKSTPFDQVQLKAGLSAGFKYTFSLDVDWGDIFAIPDKVTDCLEEVVTFSFSCSPMNFLPEAKVGFTIEAGANAELNLEGITFLPYASEYIVAKKKLEEIPIGPLLFVPHVEVVARLEGEASSQFKLSAKAAVGASAGISFSTQSNVSFQTPSFDHSFEAPSVAATLSARGKVAVGPRLHLRLYNFAGPYASLFAFAEVLADSQANPCWRLIGGVEGDFGFEIVTPDLPVVGSLTIARFGPVDYGIASNEVDSGACEPVATGPGGGQGGSFDPAAFANPTFTPWAKSYGGVVDGFPIEGPGAQIEWSQLTPTIDGRIMLTGSDTNALVKLGTDGTLIWAKRYVADIPFWRDTLIPDVLPGLVVNTDDAAMLVVAHPYVLLKVDSGGNLLWSKHFEVDSYRETWIRLSGAVSDGAGGFFLAGTFGEDYSTPVETVDGLIMRIRADGTPIWSKRFGVPNKGEVILTLLPYHEGIVVGGSAWDPSVSRWTPFVHRYGRDGDVVFQRDLIIDDCEGNYIYGGHLIQGAETQDGDLVFAHHFVQQGFVSGLVRFKPNGDLSWNSQFGPSELGHLGPIISSFVELPTGGYLAAGSYSGTQTESDWFLANLDGLGRPVWFKRIGGVNVPETIGRDEDSYPSLLLTNDGGLIIGGFSEAYAFPEDALVAMKVPAKNGEITFAPGSSVASSPVGFGTRAHCFANANANLPPRDLVIPVSPLPITVETVQVEQRTHTP